jgi:DNA-binding Lrp family transcriptional regulator
MKLDEIDRKIIALLCRNARMTLSELGQRVNLSAPAVKRRVDRLEADGAIRGYVAIIDQAALGWETEAFLEVYCERKTTLDALRDALADDPEVIGAYSVAGDAEALVHVRTSGIAELEQAIERIHAQPTVTRTRTQVVLSKLVERQASGPPPPPQPPPS